MSGKAKAHRKRNRIILIVELVILLVLLAALFVWLKFGMINFRDIGEVKPGAISKKTEKTLSGYTNFMVFGVDNRRAGNYDTGNTDVQIIVSINNDTKKIRMASLYRDTIVDIDPTGNSKFAKCNAAYAYGGEKEAMEMVNENLELNLDKFVTVDFRAVSDVVDDVGGLEINVTPAELQALNAKPLVQEVARASGKTPKLVTKSGLQTLNGDQVTAYCRIRHTAGGDFTRASRQREVMNLLLQKVKGASVSELNKILDDVLPKISTNFSATQILSIATAAKSYSIDKSFGFPFDKTTATINPYGSIVIPCTLATNVEKLHQRMFDEESYTPNNVVNSISRQIVTITGKTEQSDVDFSSSENNKGIDDTGTTSESTTTTTQ